MYKGSHTRKRKFQNVCSKFIGLVSIALLILNFTTLQAQKFIAQVSKNKLMVGEAFQLSFTVNTSASNFKAPNLSEFDLYSGPNQSTSMQIINGSMSQSLSISYVLAPKKEGKLTIGPASILIAGNKTESNSIALEVLKGNTNQNQGQQNNASRNGNQNQSQQDNSNETTGENDLFVRSFLNKKSCFLGEQIVITHKVYSRLNLVGFQNFKAPAYNGFWSQEENRNKQITLQTENVDGLSYYVAEVNQTYLFPQRTGKLSIDAVEITCVVRRQTNRRPSNLFEQFFGSGGYEDVQMKIKSKPVQVEVNPLPENGKHPNFSGAVGNFSFKAELNKDKLKANDGLNLKISLNGKGNLKLIEDPKIKFPESFETFDPKVSENISVSGGVSGTKTYDYLIIPRQAGEFKIDNIHFSYFDPEKKIYVNIPAPEFSITVSPAPENGDANNAQVYNPKTKIEEKENDIRYIKKGDLELKENNIHFFNSFSHWSLVISPVVLLAGLLVITSIQRKNNMNLNGAKMKKAAGIAKKQLNNAERLKNQNKKDDFYSELLIALNGYAGNKFSIPVAELSKERIEKELSKRSANKEIIDQFTTTISECEFAKYAPGSVSGDLNKVYNEAIQLISKIENELKA